MKNPLLPANRVELIGSVTMRNWAGRCLSHTQWEKELSQSLRAPIFKRGIILSTESADPIEPAPTSVAPQKSLRELAHDLSNALEVIMQSSFLLSTLELGENGRQWHQLLEGGIAQATKLNGQLRESLRAESNGELPGPR